MLLLLINLDVLRKAKDLVILQLTPPSYPGKDPLGDHFVSMLPQGPSNHNESDSS